MGFSETIFVLHRAHGACKEKNQHEKRVVFHCSGDTAERSPPSTLNLERSQLPFLFLKATEAVTPQNKQQLFSPAATHN